MSGIELRAFEFLVEFLRDVFPRLGREVATASS